MNIDLIVVFLPVLIFLELAYLKIATNLGVVDKHNHRSSHTGRIIRGGGIIFPIALLLVAIYSGVNYGYFIAGLLLIGLISFIDDIKTISNRTRIICHFIAVALLFYQLSMYAMPLYWIALGFIFVIGTINAMNFMDGINGITGGYGLVALLTFYYINQYIITFTNSAYLTAVIVSVLVFCFFNFRKAAKCFAGDVGSVSLAFIILFFLLQLIIKTSNLNYILFLLIYGLDAVTTIFFRIVRKENIFEAHRSHFYQFLANEKKIPHLLVSALYMFTQAIINVLVINCLSNSVLGLTGSVFVALTLFLIARIYFESLPRLLFKKVS